MSFLFLAGLVAVVVAAPRRYALLGIAVGVLYLTQNQALQVFSFNLFPTRILALAAFARVVSRREFVFPQLGPLGTILLAMYAYGSLILLLRSGEGLAYHFGVAVDALLCFGSFVGLIREWEDLRWFLRAWVLMLLPFVLLLIFEQLTHKNLFATSGPDLWLRAGKLRCYGSFRHPSLLGTLGASFLPLYVGLWFSPPDRKRAMVGIILCALIVFASNSGGPLTAMILGFCGWGLWQWRERMRTVRWAVLAGVAGLALVMKAPVWFILARVSSITGGDGWHRAKLIDFTIQDMDKWWLAGMPIKETAGWFPYLIFNGNADITNEYVSQAITAGLGAVALCLLLLAQAYRLLGQAMQSARQHAPEVEPLLWGLGVMLTVHAVNWLGITYFDQIRVVWFLQLATIASVGAQCVRWTEAAWHETDPSDNDESLGASEHPSGDNRRHV
jgi:hypothetical protein